jgi:hypothetical protein
MMRGSTALAQIGRLAAGASIAVCLVPSAQAIGLLEGLGGPAGYGELAMSPNDDGSSNLLSLPFTVNFFGSSFGNFYVNNNGNITFNSPLSAYTPDPFPIADQPMIAPWWGDVDTRGGVPTGNLPSNAVYVAAPNASTVVVTWNNVGYYGSHTDKLNNFQLVLRDRSDTGAGNFDFDFRYDRLEWTTGDASGGAGGLGGIPAQAGYDDGQQSHYYTLPGSRTAEVLNLAATSNVSESTPGLWTFAVRNGLTPGEDPSNPLMPVIVEGSFQFDFHVVLGTTYYVDPAVALGYDFVITGAGSPSFQSVVLPNIGDGHFDLLLWNGTEYVMTAELEAGEVYDFGAGGVRGFRVTGIEASAGLDPSDPTAFVTGLTFTGTGDVSMTQTALVPEPSTYALMLVGLLGVGVGAARRRPAGR